MDTQPVVDLAGKIGDKVSSIIDQLCAQLGIAAEHFYPIYVKQMMVEGIAELASICSSFIVFILCTFLIVKSYRKCSETERNKENNLNFDDSNYFPLYILSIFLTIAFGALFFVCFVNSPVYIGKCFNPEYAALQKIISMVK